MIVFGFAAVLRFLHLDALLLSELFGSLELFLALATPDDALGAEDAGADQDAAPASDGTSDAHLLTPIGEIVIIVGVVGKLIIAGDELTL